MSVTQGVANLLAAVAMVEKLNQVDLAAVAEVPKCKMNGLGDDNLKLAARTTV